MPPVLAANMYGKECRHISALTVTSPI